MSESVLSMNASSLSRNRSSSAEFPARLNESIIEDHKVVGQCLDVGAVAQIWSESNRCSPQTGIWTRDGGMQRAGFQIQMLNLGFSEV